MDKIEQRLHELEMYFVGSFIPYNGDLMDKFIAKMERVDTDYAKSVVSKLREYWRLIDEQKNETDN